MCYWYTFAYYDTTTFGTKADYAPSHHQNRFLTVQAVTIPRRLGGADSRAAPDDSLRRFSGRHANADDNPHTDGYPDVHSLTHADPDPNSHPYADAHTNPYANAPPDDRGNAGADLSWQRDRDRARAGSRFQL